MDGPTQRRTLGLNMNAIAYFITMLIVAGMSLFLGIGMEYDHDKTIIADAYGCGRKDAEPPTVHYDPAEYDLPPCAKIRQMWLWGEEWPER